MSNDRNQIKNPLLDIVDEDISRMPIRMSFFEKMGLIGALIISVSILLFACLSFFIDLFIKLNYTGIFIDLLVIYVCMTATYFIINVLRRKIVAEALVDTAFQHGVYARLQSLIENIATTQVGTDIVMDRISNLDTKIENILRERRPEIEAGVGTRIWEEPIALGTSLRFVVKAIFMIVLTMAVFMFLVNFNIGMMTPYATLFIFILWWLFITNEYSLWKETGAWTFVSFPIIVVPVTVMVLANIMNYNVMMALLYSLIGLYSLSYYIWAVYATTGVLPFITPKRNEFEERGEFGESGEFGEFFSSQQKGMFREMLGETRYRIKPGDKNKRQ